MRIIHLTINHDHRTVCARVVNYIALLGSDIAILRLVISGINNSNVYSK